MTENRQTPSKPVDQPVFDTGLTAGVPTRNGRTYPALVIESALKRADSIMLVYENVETPALTDSLGLVQPFMCDERLMVRMVAATQPPMIEAAKHPGAYLFRSFGRGTLDTDNVVSDFVLEGFILERKGVQQ